ncbi:MAG: hypothetical protein K0R26_862 [Bacteroidota bacterium]|jgi:hypothetical protein|nr:hypothetical protein [Bacteroidota bacterium]
MWSYNTLVQKDNKVIDIIEKIAMDFKPALHIETSAFSNEYSRLTIHFESVEKQNEFLAALSKSGINNDVCDLSI